MEKAPPEFRAEYERLKTVYDPNTGKSIAELLGEVRGGVFEVHQSGGYTMTFWGGWICGYDHTGRFPLVYAYGPIYQLHKKLGGPGEGCFGRPITSVTDLPDGSQCCITEGGHIHSMGGVAEPFPADRCMASYKPVAPPRPFGIGPGGLPAAFHQRWVELSTVRHPSGKMIVELLGLPRDLSDNACGGQRFRFDGGHLVSINNQSLPYVIYGEIWNLWRTLGATDSGWGRPLTDEQELEDGGRCSVFEGGHIHSYGGIAQGYPAEQCTARYKPVTRALIWNQMPPSFQRKWSQFAVMIQPLARKSVVQLLGEPWHRLSDNPKKPGQNFHFISGLLVSLDNTESPQGGRVPYSPPVRNDLPFELTQPFAIYGPIYEFFRREKALEGKFGRPLCDEQDLGDAGRCQIFEGGHIHMYNGIAQEADPKACTAPYQPQGPPPPPSSISPNPNFQSSSAVHHHPDWSQSGAGGYGGGGYHGSGYQPTPQPQIYGEHSGQSGQHATGNTSKRPGGFWYCLTGIDLNEAPEECGPWCVYATTGLQPGQHSGYCCHGCCHVRV